MKEKNKKGRELSELSDRTAMKIGIGITILGLIFMAFGIWRGEMAVVFEKAVNICMECIGIG